jgi:hypothetical protein
MNTPIKKSGGSPDPFLILMREFYESKKERSASKQWNHSKNNK